MRTLIHPARSWLLLIVWTAGVLAVGGGTAHAQGTLAAGVLQRVRGALVAIAAKNCSGRPNESSHGFVVKDAQGQLHVVATLHGIAGCRTLVLSAAHPGTGLIYKKTLTEPIGLTFLRTADLALIPLDAWDGFLSLSQGGALPDEVYAIGFHDDANAVSAKPLAVRPTTHATLGDHVGTNTAQLLAAAVPGLQDAPILLFDGNLTPGASGMPVVTRTGVLVGIAQGGLALGALGTCWAILH
jgi:hypothetical protein